MNRPVLALFFMAAGALGAHPMGNLSVSHYSRIDVSVGGVSIRYVLDLAEIPTLELLQQWNAGAGTPQPELDRHAAAQAREWARNLRIVAGGRAVPVVLDRASVVLSKAAADMPTARVTAELHADAPSGSLTYEDGNFPDRAGWKEIVIVPGADAMLRNASPAGADRSRELTAYPTDALLAPPQDLKATLQWSSAAQTSAAPGIAVRGDDLSKLLHQGDLGWGMTILGMMAAFALGAIHALSPGHGKTIVAAYLVGSRGTMKHAAFLGGMVTFTHTASVFFLGFVTLFLSRYVLPERIYPVLGAISGLSIVWIGAMLFFRRMRNALHGHPHYHHHHDHDHGDGHAHSHVPEGEVTMGSLIALGASGGLVPCPSALVLLLSSVALRRISLGLTLLVAFSTGLAVVLMGIGMMVLCARHLLPDSRKTSTNLVFRYLPVASAGVIVCAGLLMTGVALGVIRPLAGM